MAKRGRRPRHYVTPDGETIVGLARRKSDGRWRIIGTNITFTEEDEKLAVFRFAQWQRGQAREFVTFKKPLGLKELDKDETFRERADDFGAFVIDKDGNITTDIDVPADIVWTTLRGFMLAKPTLAAQKLGIPQISYIADLQPPGPSPNLEDIGNLYFDKARITLHERRKSRLFWREFVKAIGVKTLRELTADRLAEYHDGVMNAGKSQVYVKHRFGKIKTILRFARTRGVSPTDTDAVLARCAILQAPRGTTADLHPIRREDFHKLLAAADDKWKVGLLCSLNFCMYAAEIALVERTEINVDERTLVTDRRKTGVTRVAVLWPRTVRAIHGLPEHPSAYLLVSEIGKPYHPDHIRRNFERLRARAGLPNSVKFSHIRDGAYTAAVQGKGVQFEHARILGGHETGMSDHYVKRNPKMVADACAAVEEHYFG